MTIECLLIDDDQDDQEIFQMALEKTGLSVHCSFASDPVEALQSLSNTSYIPAFIFIDMNMPKMNGMDCLKTIRLRKHLKSSKIIMYSTSADQIITKKCKELGADEFLAKISSLNLLAVSLNSILNRS